MKKRVILLAVCILIIGVTAFILINNSRKPLIVNSLQELSIWSYSKTAKISKHRKTELSNKQNISVIISEGWNEIEKSLRKSGASEKEVQTILKAAHKYVESHSTEGQIYQAAPILIRDAYLEDKHLWVVGFAWGYGSGVFQEGLGHIASIVIDAKTGQILTGQSCG